MKIYKTAIYLRLSNEDEQLKDESTSITNQRLSLKDYIDSQEDLIFQAEYVDDGYSGYDFSRPKFVKMLEDAEKKLFDCILVGVRFISIMDCYDNTNLKNEEYFVTQFKTFAHAVYALETSKKVGDAYKKMQENGQFAAGNPPYGYLRSPSNPHKLIIDENIRPIIVEIFERIANGENQTSIAEDLSRRKIPTPKGKSTEWTKLNVNLIYRKEIYLGTLIFRKQTQSFYRGEGVKRHRERNGYITKMPFLPLFRRNYGIKHTLLPLLCVGAEKNDSCLLCPTFSRK